MTEELKEIQQKASDGADLKKFKEGSAGIYLYKQAELDEMAALRKIITVPPDDKEAIYKLQLAAAVPRKAIEWIERAMAEGKEAMFQLEEMEAEARDY